MYANVCPFSEHRFFRLRADPAIAEVATFLAELRDECPHWVASFSRSSSTNVAAESPLLAVLARVLPAADATVVSWLLQQQLSLA